MVAESKSSAPLTVALCFPFVLCSAFRHVLGLCHQGARTNLQLISLLVVLRSAALIYFFLFPDMIMTMRQKMAKLST